MSKILFDVNVAYGNAIDVANGLVDGVYILHLNQSKITTLYNLHEPIK